MGNLHLLAVITFPNSGIEVPAHYHIPLLSKLTYTRNDFIEILSSVLGEVLRWNVYSADVKIIFCVKEGLHKPEPQYSVTILCDFDPLT